MGKHGLIAAVEKGSNIKTPVADAFRNAVEALQDAKK
jgi:hypothetical protein